MSEIDEGNAGKWEEVDFYRKAYIWGITVVKTRSSRQLEYREIPLSINKTVIFWNR